MISNSLNRLTDVGQMAAMAVFGLAAVAGIVASGLAFTEFLPWPEVTIGYGGALVPWAGMALQLGITALFTLIAIFLPSARRVRRLEGSHRRFEMDMDDVTKAYRAAHMADRAQTFEMRREFDAVRERYQFLKDQPGLAEMDAELLTIAAQMSEQSRELADAYSDTKVTRVRDSLVQRRADAKVLEERIQQAFADTRALKRLMEDVDGEESAVASQLDRLRAEVAELGVFEPEFVPAQRIPHLTTVPAE